MPRKKRRTLTERAQSIFSFIDAQQEPFPKSEFQRIGLNPTTAETWVRLIEYIQSQPRIKVTKMRSSTYIEKIENRYLSMLRKRILDSGLSLDGLKDFKGAEKNFRTAAQKVENGQAKASRKPSRAAEQGYRKAVIQALQKEVLQGAKVQLKGARKTTSKEAYAAAEKSLKELEGYVKSQRKEDFSVAEVTSRVQSQIASVMTQAGI